MTGLSVIPGRSQKVIDRMEAERQLTEGIIAKVARKAAKTVAALYEPEFNPDGTPNKRRNRDADVPWNMCSVKTRASLMLIKGMEQNKDANGDKRLFGVIVLQGRAGSAKEWEAEAKAVDDEERRKGAIDVKVNE